MQVREFAALKWATCLQRKQQQQQQREMVMSVADVAVVDVDAETDSTTALADRYCDDNLLPLPSSSFVAR